MQEKQPEFDLKSLKYLPKPNTEPPTELEIKRTIARLKNALSKPAITRAKNIGVCEGYKMAVKILESERSFSYNDIPTSELKTDQGRAIVALTIDYLIGECRQSVLCKVPIK